MLGPGLGALEWTCQRGIEPRVEQGKQTLDRGVLSGQGETKELAWGAGEGFLEGVRSKVKFPESR